MKQTSVLFVDNDADAFTGLVEGLRDTGLCVFPALSVDEALARCSETFFNVAILDLIMPSGPLRETADRNKTGLALARRLRSLYPSIAIVFWTVARDQEVKEWCERNAPAEYHLKTEFSSSFGLIDVVTSIIKRSADHALDQVRELLGGFHRAAIALRQRPSGRSPFLIEDEYDVQDLLFSLLRLRYRDLRLEEWTPSRAGARSRIDFLLLEEAVAIEVKRTRKTLSVKRLGEELLIDAARYRGHPDCRALICFVYDPEERLLNAPGLIRDIEQASSTDFLIRVVVGGHRE